MMNRCGTGKVACKSPRRRGLEGSSWLGPPGFMVVDPLNEQPSNPCSYGRPKTSVLHPRRTNSAKDQERMCDRVSMVDLCRGAKVGVQPQIPYRSWHWPEGDHWQHIAWRHR